MMRYFSFLAQICIFFNFLSLFGKPDKPNVILIFADDQGYGDLSCFGSKTIKTPHIDRIAKEGRKFTSFMVASPVCTPSRAALMTGCYPKRVGMHQHVLFPSSTKGLNPSEYTIADHFNVVISTNSRPIRSNRNLLISSSVPTELRSQYARKSIQLRQIALWQDIPADIKSSVSLSSFQNSLKEYYLQCNAS